MTLDRFLSHVEKTEGCWLWKGIINPGGYGRVWVKPRMMMAHRAAYELFVGPIPDGLCLDHLCRVRHCVNPAHLEPVTWQENLARGLSAVHQTLKTHCPHGHPYAGRNLRVRPNGVRECRTCNREGVRKRDLARRGPSKNPRPFAPSLLEDHRAALGDQ